MCRIIKQMLMVIGDICRRHNETLIMEYAKQICYQLYILGYELFFFCYLLGVVTL